MVTSVWAAHWRVCSRLSELGVLKASQVTRKDSMICQCRCCILERLHDLCTGNGGALVVQGME